MERRGFRQSWKKNHESVCKCAHEQVAHYTKSGKCIVPACGCLEFRIKGREDFQNKRATCQFGHAHDSGTEIKVCFDLYCQKAAKEIKDFRFHPVINLPGPSGSTVSTYEVDFVVEHWDGITEFVEVKGDHIKYKQPWPLKWKLLKDKHKGDRMYKFRVVLD